MPLVTATDAPYQPYPTGRTSPQAPDAYERIQTSPAMFGALQAEALEKAGAQGEKLAGEIAKIGVYQQRMQDLAELDQLAAIRDDRLHKEKYGDPEAGIDLATGKPRVPGIKNMLGADALDYIKSGAPNKAYENIVGSLAGSASSDRVRQMFLHQSRAQRVAYDNVVGEHWNQQLQAHNAAVLKANDYNVSRTITKGYNNDVELETAINQKIDFLTRGVTDPEIRAARYYAAVTEGAADAIQAALADNNPRRAAQLLSAYKDHMDGDAISKLHPRVQHALDELTIAEALLAPRQPGAGFRAPPGPAIEGATAAEQQLLNEIRFRESSNRYDLVHPPAADGVSAGGAYGFRPETWKEATAATGVGTEYATADKAPAKVQDANALWLYRNRGTQPWAASGPYGGAVEERQGAAIRNLPIAKTVNAQLERAATAVGDLKVEVFSGGQPSTGPNRTGSHRHDEGGAADIQLRDVKTSRLLDMRNPDDRARMQKFITEAVAAGATGVGAAEDYMGPHGIHIGGGTPAAWGAGGSSANAPDWVKAGFEAGRARMARTQAPRAAGMIEPPNIALPSR